MPRSVSSDLHVPTQSLQQRSPILATVYFYMASELRIVCTFLTIKNIIKRKIIFCHFSTVYEIQMFVPIYKVFLENSHIVYSHIFYSNFHATATELSSFKRTYGP